MKEKVEPVVCLKDDWLHWLSGPHSKLLITPSGLLKWRAGGTVEYKRCAQGKPVLFKSALSCSPLSVCESQQLEISSASGGAPSVYHTSIYWPPSQETETAVKKSCPRTSTQYQVWKTLKKQHVSQLQPYLFRRSVGSLSPLCFLSLSAFKCTGTSSTWCW